MKATRRLLPICAASLAAVVLTAGCRKTPEVFHARRDGIAIQSGSKWLELASLRQRADEFLTRQGVAAAAVLNADAFVYTDKGSNLVEFLYSTELGKPSFIVRLDRAGAVSSFTAGMAADRTRMISNENSR